MEDFDFLQASTLNDVVALCGTSVLRAAWSALVRDSHHYIKKVRIVEVICKMGPKIQVQKPKLILKRIRNSPPAEDISQVAALHSGIHLVRLEQRGKSQVDNVICVNVDAGIILDSAEKYPMKLCKKSLAMRSGPDCNNARIVEMLQILRSE